MEEALRTLLLGAQTVTSLVGTRIDWGARVQGAGLPAIVMMVVSDVNDHLLSGPADPVARVQIDCWGGDYASAKATARAVRAVLDGTRSGILKAVLLENVRDGREGGSNEADRPFRTSLDVFVHYHRP